MLAAARVPEASIRVRSEHVPAHDLHTEVERDRRARTERIIELGRWIVPIIPDEARTFGMEGMFHQYGIYSNVGQLYEPVDYKTLLRYREARDG